MSVKCRRNLVDEQNKTSLEALRTYIICSMMRTGYEPPTHTSDKTRAVESQDATV